MSKTLVILILLLLCSTTLEAAPPRFGGKKILRKANRNSKNLQRKNGIGQAETVKWEEVANV